jgi:site-specific recombinase XerD
VHGSDRSWLLRLCGHQRPQFIDLLSSANVPVAKAEGCGTALNVPIMFGMSHPDFAVLTASWELALQADGYADNTIRAYQNAVRSLAGWLSEHHPEVGPAELEHQHIRGWLVEVRERHSSNTARGWFAGVRHFCRWLEAEGGFGWDATAEIRTPAQGDPETPVLSDADLRALLSTCAGTDFTALRDRAIIMLFLDGGLRLSELAGLQVADVDLRDRVVHVVGKASRRSGPLYGAVPLGVKAARALDRYLRERRRHPYADTPRLWLGSRGRPALSADGIDAMLKRRGAEASIADLHPHAFRHTWAHAFRAVGGNEDDLMLLGGWRNRAMLDRYGKAAASDRAADAYRRLSLGDRI